LLPYNKILLLDNSGSLPKGKPSLLEIISYNNAFPKGKKSNIIFLLTFIAFTTKFGNIGI